MEIRVSRRNDMSGTSGQNKIFKAATMAKARTRTMIWWREISLFNDVSYRGLAIHLVIIIGGGKYAIHSLS